MTTFHIYCDESCHLEHDGHRVMVLGAIACPADRRREVAVALRALKQRHGLKPDVELKWTKVSPAKLAYFRDVLDLFLDDPDLRFRAVVVPDKTKLRHADFAQTHDDFYFKTYYLLIERMLEAEHEYKIFLDIKDTRSWSKTLKLKQVLANKRHDFDSRIIRSIELVRSEQVELVQLADLLTGCVSYANRELATSPAKVALVEHLRARTRLRLTLSTLLMQRKLNIFVWRPREAT